MNRNLSKKCLIDKINNNKKLLAREKEEVIEVLRQNLSEKYLALHAAELREREEKERQGQAEMEEMRERMIEESFPPVDLDFAQSAFLSDDDCNKF